VCLVVGEDFSNLSTAFLPTDAAHARHASTGPGGRPFDGRGEPISMNAEISHVGRCMISHEGKPCNQPAAYVQIWSASRVFRYCEEHVPPLVKKTARAASHNNRQDSR